MNGSKITILGLGAVSRSLVNLLIREKAFSFDDIRVADMSEEAYSYFSSIGGKKENFINVRFDSKNYLDIFADMKKVIFWYDLLTDSMTRFWQKSAWKEAFIS